MGDASDGNEDLEDLDDPRAVEKKTKKQGYNLCIEPDDARSKRLDRLNFNNSSLRTPFELSWTRATGLYSGISSGCVWPRRRQGVCVARPLMASA